MSPLPSPSLRVLIELAATYLSAALATGSAATLVRRRFVELVALLEQQAGVLADVDRIEAAIVAQLGYPRVALPTPPGGSTVYAADAGTIRAHLGTGAGARRRIAALRRQQRHFMQATAAAGLPAGQTHERRLAAEINDTAAALLLAHVADLTDVAGKLIVLIAMSEPGSVESTAFPAASLRTLLADIAQLRRGDQV